MDDKRAIYEHEHRLTAELILEHGLALDKALLSLSAGSFVVSLALLAQVPEKIDLRLLYSSWILFGVTIAAVLVSMLFNQEAVIRARRRNDAWFARAIGTGEPASQEDPEELYDWLVRFSDWASILTFASILYFLIGGTTMTLFAIDAMKGEAEMRNGNQETSAQGPAEKKSLPPYSVRPDTFPVKPAESSPANNPGGGTGPQAPPTPQSPRGSGSAGQGGSTGGDK